MSSQDLRTLTLDQIPDAARDELSRFFAARRPQTPVPAAAAVSGPETTGALTR